jgi:uracil phosphoribosyltransferase
VDWTAPLSLLLQARSYLNKLPEKFAEDDLILITDPMLATGGTMMQVGSPGGGRKC